jgi:hypothetical protein
MDWNKSYNILIIAFLIVNILLFSFIYISNKNDINNDLKDREEFLTNVISILGQRDIKVSYKVPSEIYEAPFLELEYNIIQPNRELIEQFIGKFDGVINDEVLKYNSESESIEIEGMKEIIYYNNALDNSSSLSSKDVQKIINDFCAEKKIDLTGFTKICEYTLGNLQHVKFVEKHRGYSLENSYVEFTIKNGHVYTFAMQRVARINERANIKSISAAEALLRLMTFDDISNKDVMDMQICYYTKEDEDFKNKNLISTDLIWKVIFSDNTYVYLAGDEIK